MTAYSGTSYLGLDKNTAYLQLIKTGLDRYGSHYGGSRLSPSCPDIFALFEEAFAEWAGAPAALLVGSGSAAGQLVARYLANQPQPLLLGPGAHPALWWPQGTKYTDWSTFLGASQRNAGNLLVDALNPLRISAPPWEAILTGKHACLVVDDSHPIGCYGPGGKGSWQQLRSLVNGRLLITASLGKAFALPAGIIIGPADTLAAIRSLPQYGGASPPAPAHLYAWLHGQGIIRTQQARLGRHLHRLRLVIAQVAGVHHLEGFPVFGLERHEWGPLLRKFGIAISAFRYPEAHSPMYSRIVIRADHSEEEIDRLSEALESVILSDCRGEV